MAETTEETPTQADNVDGCVSSKVEKTEKSQGGDEKVAENGKKSSSQNGEEEKANDAAAEENSESEPELYFAPKVTLPLVDVNTLEDDEEVVVELRARIYRYDDSEGEAEFKERGTGILKILYHQKKNMYRILIRRDKTHKICANHYITSLMELNKHNSSDKVFVYSTLADLYEGETHPETFAIRFGSPENATIFKNAFNDAVKAMKQKEKEEKKAAAKEVDDLSKVLGEVDLDAKTKKDQTETEK